MENKKKSDKGSVFNALAIGSAMCCGALLFALGCRQGYLHGTSKMYDVLKGWNAEYAEEFYIYLENSTKMKFRITF